MTKVISKSTSKRLSTMKGKKVTKATPLKTAKKATPTRKTTTRRSA